MEEKICQCNIPANLQQEQIYEKIAEYIRNLEPEYCVMDEDYEKRLSVCSTCKDLIGGLTCRFCGCFVLARARKKAQHCPCPGQDRWK